MGPKTTKNQSCHETESEATSKPKGKALIPYNTDNRVNAKHVYAGGLTTLFGQRMGTQLLVWRSSLSCACPREKCKHPCHTQFQAIPDPFASVRQTVQVPEGVVSGTCWLLPLDAPPPPPPPPPTTHPPDPPLFCDSPPMRREPILHLNRLQAPGYSSAPARLLEKLRPMQWYSLRLAHLRAEKVAPFWRSKATFCCPKRGRSRSDS